VLAVVLAACGGEQGEPVTTAVPAATPDETVKWAVDWPEAWPEGRLPAGVTPNAYRLDLEIFPDHEQFGGRVEIDITVDEPIEGFWLHGYELDVESALVTAGDGAVVPAQYRQIGADGVAWLALAEELPAGPATVIIEYVADFGRGLYGLYKVTVGDDNYAFTQFESTHARKAFPSFDEPAFKTPFSIAVTTRAEFRALSNTKPLERIPLPDGTQRVNYATTEPLPTYLVAFAVGPLDVVEHAPVPANDIRAEPLQLRGVAARGQGDRLRFALDNTATLVADLENYFGIGFPFDKLDLVAVPDFSGGAMENAGLMTYRESILLFDDPAPFAQQRFFGLIHAHELGHNWFGNLVTMPWWDDIWLNEAFASWIQARAAQAWRPEFNYAQSVQARALRAMANDSLDSARQIREPVNNGDDIVSAFDTITYQKGAAVLQMFERYIGEEKFQQGIQAYLKQFASGSATVFDLLDSLERAADADKPVREPFESFLFQPGVPYIEVGGACSANTLKLAMSQQRYLPAGSAGSRDRTWQVPVCVTLGSGQRRDEHCVLLTSARQRFDVPVAQCPDWILPNAGGAGYFRWLVENDMGALADRFLDDFDAGERLAYVDSLAAGINAGKLDPGVFLDNLPRMAMAPERLAVNAAVTAYQQMLDFLVADEDLPAARQIGIEAFGVRLERLKREVETINESDRALLTAKLTELLALWLKDADTRAQLQQQAHRYLGYPGTAEADRTALDPDLLRPALTVAVQDGDRAFVEFLIEDIRASDNARHRQAGVRALAHTTDPGVIDDVRAFALSGALRGNEFQNWVSYLLNPDSRDINWPWVQQSIHALMSVATSRVVRQSPQDFARGLCTPDDAQTLRDLFGRIAGEYRISTRSVDQGVETIELCAALRDTQATAVANHFSRR
jgi:alanyl aminopeptidase